MEFKNQLLNLRNKIDFKLRSVIRLKRPVDGESPIPGIDYKVQKEFQNFATLFPWASALAHMGKENTLVVADVGARNFCFAPIIDTLFKDLGYKIELHGIEIDSYRRLANLHTRYDYGMFYAKQCRDAAFHPIDFMKFTTPLDICFLLNPFVSDEPTLQWGLPLTVLKPKDFFEHAYSLIKPNGLCILSNPSAEEYEIACQLAVGCGFSLGQEALWNPKQGSQQQKPRYGIILHKKEKGRNT